MCTVKPILSGHSKIEKTKVLKTNGSLMKVESIAECSKRAFCNTFDLHSTIIFLENQILVFFLSGPLRQVLLYLSQVGAQESSSRGISLAAIHKLKNRSKINSQVGMWTWFRSKEISLRETNA